MGLGINRRLAVEGCPRQAFAEEPDRACVRDAVAEPKTKKAHERQPVVDEVFRAFVREVVGRLDHQHLEHHHRIKRSTSASIPRHSDRCLSMKCMTAAMNSRDTRKASTSRSLTKALEPSSCGARSASFSERIHDLLRTNLLTAEIGLYRMNWSM